MTVTTTTTYNELAGTAGVFAYAFTFRCDDTSWVKVYLDDALSGSGYSVALNADQDTSPGGTVTFVTAPDGYDVRIQRETAKTQETDYTAYDAFPAETHELALDKLTVEVQDEARDRATGDSASAALVTAEAVARAAADAAIVASGIEPANVGIAPVTPTGSTTQDTVENWLARFDPGFVATGSVTQRKPEDRVANVANVLDFGADGGGTVDDTAAVQAAIDSGKNVYLPPGTYSVTTLTMDNASQTLFGDGPLSILKSADPTEHTIVVEADRVTIRDLRINGTATSANLSIHAIHTAAAAPARWLGVERVTFSGADGSHGLTNGVKYDTASDYGWVKECNFENLWGTASGSGYGVLAGEVDGLVVSGNTFIAAVGRGRHAIYFSAGCKYCIAAHNYIESFNYEGIAIYSQAAQPPNLGHLIAGNSLYNCGVNGTLNDSAISIFGHGSRNRIIGNVIKDSLGNGIKLDGTGYSDLLDTIISENVIDNAAFYGIQVIAGIRGVMTGNFVLDCGGASAGTYPNIQFVSDATTASRDWVVTGNHSSGPTNTRSAVQLNSTAPVPSGIVLSGNYFEECVTYTIEFMSGTSAVVDGIVQGYGTTFPTFIAGSADPTAGAGVVAGIGSLYFRTSGGATTSLYVKTGAGDTAWTAK